MVLLPKEASQESPLSTGRNRAPPHQLNIRLDSKGGRGLPRVWLEGEGKGMCGNSSIDCGVQASI